MSVFLWSCSTTNHGILPTMAYHDITSHYNAYFNSNEKMKATFKSAEASHKDKFDSVIAVYSYSDPKDFASFSSDLDDVIKRSTLAIQLHNISNWSDDHMLLIGEANYLKGDYDKAASSFKYITTEFKEGVDYVKVMRGLGKPLKKYVKAKKKVKKPEVRVVVNKDGTKTLEKIDNRPEISLWIHTPARSAALVWLINTYSRQGKFDDAASVVTYVKGDNLFFKNFDSKLDLAEADLEVSRKNYGNAIAPLEKYLAAKKVRHRKALKTRPYFVLAQCYEAIGNNSKAVEHYKNVLKCRPSYDMEFYAKLKMAKLSRGSGSDNAAVRSLLAKMAKDGSYKDYYDQIYYELAMISLQENNRDEARKFLHKSIDYSASNEDQKALAYLKLAELDYEDENYVASKFFFDSTLLSMAKNDSRYSAIDERDKTLSNLVKQLNIIAEEDSLQKLASLSPEQLKKAVKDALDKKEAEAEKKKDEAESLRQQQQLDAFKNNNQQNSQQSNQNQTLGSTWYFYNTAARAQGYNNFISKWGRRKLEENWRRQNKTSSSGDETDNSASADSTSADGKDSVIANGTPEEQMLASVPTTPEKLQKSTDRIVEAYYTAGSIYKDELENLNKAKLMFETVNNRFAKHKLLLESLYNLYLIAKTQKQNERADELKNRIINEFPESVIAKILRNPDYINETKKQENEVNTYYEDTYRDYSSGNLDTAWYKAKMSDALFKPNPLSSKFELLIALIYAKQNRLAEYVQQLQKLSNNSKDVEVKQTATNLLSLLNKSSLPQIDLSADSAKRAEYNAQYNQPDTLQSDLQKQLEAAKELAKQQGKDVKVAPVDTTSIAQQPKDNKQATNVTEKKDSVVNNVVPVVTEDTSSIYKRTDNEVHYFIVYIKDAAVTENSLLSVKAKIEAYNSTVYETKKLVTKRVQVDSKTRVINVRQFKNKEDVVNYFKDLSKQNQLFTELLPSQYNMVAVSITNWDILTSNKTIDDYQKFFARLYK